MLLAPIPAAITRESPHVLRSIFILGSLQILVGLGIVDFVQWLKHKWRIYQRISYGVIILLIGLNIWVYFSAYFTQYPKEYSQSWQYGYKQAVEYLMSNKDHYDNVIFTKRYGEPHEYALWYGKINPRTYLANLESGKVNWNFHDNWYWIDGIDNVVFVNDWELNNYLLTLPRKGRNLVLSSADNPAPEEPLLLINFLDGSLAFKISKQ
jgi:hypothetical protein